MSDAAIQELAEWHRKIKAFEQQKNTQIAEQERILVSQRQQIEVLKAENAKLQEEKLLSDSAASFAQWFGSRIWALWDSHGVFFAGCGVCSFNSPAGTDRQAA